MFYPFEEQYLHPTCEKPFCMTKVNSFQCDSIMGHTVLSMWHHWTYDLHFIYKMVIPGESS